MTKPDPHRKALLAKAARLVWRLNARVVAMKLRESRAETIGRIGHLAVAEAILSTPGETP